MIKAAATPVWLGALIVTLTPALEAQYLAPRQYLRRIEQQTTPPPAPAKPAPSAQPVATNPAVPPAPVQYQQVTRPKDPAKAQAEKEALTKRMVEFDRKQAEAGSPSAQYELGMRYLLGDGVEQNAETATQWFEKAAKKGYSKAARQLEQLRKEAESKPKPKQ